MANKNNNIKNILDMVALCGGNFSEAARKLGVSKSYVWEVAHKKYPRASVGIRKKNLHDIFMKNPLASNREISYNYGIDLDTVRRKRIKYVGIKNVCEVCRLPISLRSTAKRYHKRCLKLLRGNKI